MHARERRVHPRILGLRLLGYGAREVDQEEARHEQNSSYAPHPALRHAEQAIRFHVMGDARAGDHRDPEPYRHEPNGHHDERDARSVGPGQETDPSVEEVGFAFELLLQPGGLGARRGTNREKCTKKNIIQIHVSRSKSKILKI